VRRRLGWWLLVAVLAAGCTTSNANEGTASDQTDVWFMQRMAGHLLQTTAVLDLAGDRITHPDLARLADMMNQQGHAHQQQLQGWLDRRGLAPYDPQQDPNRRKKSDLARLAEVRGAGFDLAFLEVMVARHRAGSRLAATEFRNGVVPEVRRLAAQLLAEYQAQVNKMTAWRRTWAKADANGRTG
jgi:uncharacterized protein (DUF305 family)